MGAKEAADEEAFRTAVGMARAVGRRDLEGLKELWYASEEPDRVAHWMAAITSVAAIEAGARAGVGADEWLAQQVSAYEKYGRPQRQENED